MLRHYLPFVVLYYQHGYLKIPMFPKPYLRGRGQQKTTHFSELDLINTISEKYQIPVILVSQFFLISSSNIPITLLQT